jgi:hypothetical protein
MTLRELFNAVLDGKVLQTQTNEGWVDCYSRHNALCVLATRGENPEQMRKVRIKPEPKPDVVKYGGVYQKEDSNFTALRGAWDAPVHVLSKTTVADEEWPLKAKIKVVFDGESGEVKSVEKVN